VAPGEEPPDLDADAFDVDDDEEQRIFDDILALEDEEAE
jgi:hypothetical protein